MFAALVFLVREGVVLYRVGFTLFSSAIRVAYSEGVLLRLGGSQGCSKEDWPGNCSALMNLFISNNRKESISQLALSINTILDTQNFQANAHQRFLLEL